jgi:hypothetical protein
VCCCYSKTLFTISVYPLKWLSSGEFIPFSLFFIEHLFWQNFLMSTVLFNAKRPTRCHREICSPESLSPIMGWVGRGFKRGRYNQKKFVHRGCVRLASLGRPRSAPVRSNSFDGAHPGQPPVPCLWSGSLGGDLRCMMSPREGEWSLD